MTMTLTAFVTLLLLAMIADAVKHGYSTKQTALSEAVTQTVTKMTAQPKRPAPPQNTAAS